MSPSSLLPRYHRVCPIKTVRNWDCVFLHKGPRTQLISPNQKKSSYQGCAGSQQFQPLILIKILAETDLAQTKHIHTQPAGLHLKSTRWSSRRWRDWCYLWEQSAIFLFWVWVKIVQRNYSIYKEKAAIEMLQAHPRTKGPQSPWVPGTQNMAVGLQNDPYKKQFLVHVLSRDRKHFC